MVKKYKSILLFLIVFLIGCFPFLDSKLSLERRDYFGQELKINGFYFDTYTNEFMNNILYEVYFFYNNGIIRCTGCCADNLEQLDSIFKRDLLLDKFAKPKFAWGVYNIKGNKISFEKWGPSSGGPKKTLLRKGIILNDTTFVIKYLFNNYGKNEYTENDTFRFRKFTPKPDSTNKWIP